MNAVRELPELLEGCEQLLPRSRDVLVTVLRLPERDRESDQPLLRPVVEIPLETTALAVGDFDESSTRLGQLGQLRAKARAGRRMFERQPQRPDRLGQPLRGMPRQLAVTKLSDDGATSKNVRRQRALPRSRRRSPVVGDDRIVPRKDDRQRLVPRARRQRNAETLRCRYCAE